MNFIVISATQAFKRLVCRVLIGLFVSAQFAVAAYACPDLSPFVASLPADRMALLAEEAAPGSMGEHSAPGLHKDGKHGYAAKDAVSPQLCMAHCQSGKQSADHAPAPTAAPAPMTVMYTLPPAEELVAARVQRTRLLLKGPPGASEPAHAILHCCLRD